jgi:DNA-binding YbaB/EbfC family protein
MNGFGWVINYKLKSVAWSVFFAASSIAECYTFALRGDKTMLPQGLQRLLGSQFAKLQEQANQVLEELKAMRIEGQAGGGAVRAVVSGMGELQSVHIDPKLLNPEDAEILQDLIVVAVRDAMRNAEAVQQQKMQSLLQSLPFGGILGFGR